MSTGITAGDILRITAKCWLDEQSVQNTFYCLVTTAWPQLALALGDIQDILAAGYELVAGKQTSSLTTDALHVMNVTQDESYGDVNWGAAYTGGEDDEGEYLPGPVSALGTVVTLLPRVQGRKFLPGFTETNMMDGKFGGGTIADVLDFMEWFYLTTHGAGDAVCDFGLYNPDLERWTPAYAVAASAIPAYQRRRRIGVGS
jgi:hypothetical protein